MELGYQPPTHVQWSTHYITLGWKAKTPPRMTHVDNYQYNLCKNHNRRPSVDFKMTGTERAIILLRAGHTI
jgi:hypothetical protein